MGQIFSDLPRRGRLYILLVVVAGATAIAQSAVSLLRHPLEPDWLILAALTFLTGSFSIKVPSISARISVSEAFVFAAVLSFGPHAATLIVALDSLILTSWLRKPSRSIVRGLFNMAAGAIAISVSARLLEWLLPVQPAASAPLDQLLLPVLALALSYFGINSWLIAAALGYERGLKAHAIWRRNFLWLGLNYMGGASVALVLVSYTRDINLASVGLIIPLLVVLYLTFRTSWGRIEDANKHVAQLNDLYLSTIETLAMAVDAKDQITHGHIRRVQVYAIELAKRLGVDDDKQLKALEAAALLHDMGKLGIPEHILNKPGPLTDAEFSRMKLHVDLGADLLSSIRFPYPVVPIVRHHHENWDGTGYPSHIAGTDIPLGARILSVVDCFDALTSDRPYRPRLSNDDAFRILRERRGTMYDPLVVDSFIRAHPDIAPIATRAGLESRSVFGEGRRTLADSPPMPLRQIRASASENALLMECRRSIVHSSSPKDIVDTIARYLRHFMPITVVALFTADSRSGELVCISTSGDRHDLLLQLTIPVGQRVTGWVAANQRSVVSADAVLDLAEVSEMFTPPLRSTISTPIGDGTRLAVLTAYSFREDAFTEAHRYSFECVAAACTSGLRSPQAHHATSVVPFSARNR